MHYLLERQLKKIFHDKFQFSPELEAFLKVASDTYDSYDKDRKFLERSFDLSSKEFLELNNKILKLLEELKAEKKSVDQKVIERTKELKQKIEELDHSNQLSIKGEEELHKSQSALLNMLEDVEEERRKAEEEKNKTSAVITHLTDGLLVFDSQNNLSLINPQAKSLLQIKNDEVYNKSLDGLAASIDRFKPLLKILGKEIKEISRQEIVIEGFTLEVSSALIGPAKNRTGSLIIIHDITREKGIERMKTEFVSIAAHQLRTPLSAIKWALSLLLDGDAGKLNTEQKNFLQKSYDSNERMLILINDLLDVARIEEGKYAYNLTPAKMEKLAQNAFSDCKGLAKTRKIKIIYKKPSVALPEIKMDAEKITIAMQNLIENAIKYTPAGGQVTIGLKYDINKIEFSVKDTGVGVSKMQQDRLFTKFFRASNVIRMETDGTGLGLFITKNIINAHGGKIWCESEENKGSTFSFSLPVNN